MAMILLAILFPSIYFTWEKGRFDRVFCKKCKQQYDLYQTFSSFEREPMGNIHNEKCKCHSMVKFF